MAEWAGSQGQCNVTLDERDSAWYLRTVIIESVRHKGLRRALETGSGRGLIESERVLDMVGYLATAGSFDDLSKPPNFGFHALKGDRRGEFAMTVTKNWRLTFRKVDDHTIFDLDLEDYH